MRIRIFSDLHLEHARFDPPKAKADIVVLAGDIHEGTSGLEWASETFREAPVIYVPGNHELFNGDLNRTPILLRRRAKELGILYGNVGEHIVRDIRFLCATLWTDFDAFGVHRRAAAYAAAECFMLDYRYIRFGDRKLAAADTRPLHLAQREWLQKKLAATARGHWRATVVVTHMAPTLRSVPAQYAQDLTSGAFASHLDELVDKADMWIHGHIHTSWDYVVNARGTRVVTNPRGYPQKGGGFENPAFDSTLLVEV